MNHTFTDLSRGPLDRFEVTFTAFNNLDSGGETRHVFVLQNITGVVVEVLQEAVLPSQNATIRVSMDEGTAVDFDFSESVTSWSQYVRHPNFMSYEDPIEVDVSFLIPGNYSVEINIYNEVQDLYEHADVIVMDNITGLSISASNEVLWPDDVTATVATMDFSIDSEFSLTNVFCAWDFDDGNTENQYIATLAAGNDAAQMTHEYAAAAVGTRLVEVTCSNLVSQQVFTFEFNITRDVYELESVVGGDRVMLGDESSITIESRAFTTVSCLLVEFGDGEAEVYGTHAYCDTEAGNQGVNRQTLDVNSPTMTIGHTYASDGTFDVTVEAFNHVDSQQLTTQVEVQPLPCSQPNATFDDSYTNPARRFEVLISEEATFVPTDLQIDCQRSSDAYNVTYELWYEDTQSVVDQTNGQESYLIPAR